MGRDQAVQSDTMPCILVQVFAGDFIIISIVIVVIIVIVTIIVVIQGFGVATPHHWRDFGFQEGFFTGQNFYILKLTINNHHDCEDIYDYHRTKLRGKAD